MGRGAQGWRLRPKGPGATLFVRFSHLGKRYDLTTRTSDPQQARLEAAQIYAEIVSGRRTVLVGEDLRELIKLWLVDYAANHADETTANCGDYGKRWLETFGSLGRITEASVADYSRARIRQVTRVTLRKELSALRQFVSWLVEQRRLRVPIVVPSLPKHGHPGVRAKNARKRKASILTPAEVRKLLAALPLRSRHGWYVRPFFVVLYETGLRESTLYRIEAPRDYRKGSSTLSIPREADKAGDEREIPLTVAARRELDRVCPKSGPLFERHDWRPAWAKAVTEAGIKRPVSPYDLRHTALTELANSPGVPLGGVQYLAGHQHLSTTARYVQGQRRAASTALRARRR